MPLAIMQYINKVSISAIRNYYKIDLYKAPDIRVNWKQSVAAYCDKILAFNSYSQAKSMLIILFGRYC